MLLVSICSIAVATTLGKTIKKKIEEANRHINSEITVQDSDKGSEGNNVKNAVSQITNMLTQ